MKLLKKVGGMLTNKGYKINNADVTIICQRPKLMPYIPEMQKNIARFLMIPEDRVNVKATTEEHLGFTGRGEGISAMAAVSIDKLDK